MAKLIEKNVPPPTETKYVIELTGAELSAVLSMSYTFAHQNATVNVQKFDGVWEPTQRSKKVMADIYESLDSALGYREADFQIARHRD